MLKFYNKDTYSNNITPSLFIEQVLVEVALVKLFRLVHHLHGDDRSDEPSLQNVLQSEKDDRLELAASALEVRINNGCVLWVLLVVCDL